ncbi:MAG TPA: MBL fold metallo-hydrolase [Candidatus Limnocylindrales bacterium]|nr:MBL fold metallo-hydrolase [Candidatus Limnocylindrales bacterium]
MELAPGIRRVGSHSIVNSYLLEEAGEVTVIDAGAPGLWPLVLRELEAMGRRLDDVRAIVLTHGHSDHVGYAERARREQGWPVLVHEADETLATGRVKSASDKVRLRIRPTLGFAWWSLRRGLLRVPPLVAVATFGDGATLDLPGSPRVILVPGHTPGSAALHVASRDAVFVGDAIATYSVTDGYRGPRIAPFGADYVEARGSLVRLEGLSARMVLPGHGDAFTGGIDEAVRRTREAPLPG